MSEAISGAPFQNPSLTTVAPIPHHAGMISRISLRSSGLPAGERHVGTARRRAFAHPTLYASGIWVPSTSAFTRVFDAVCAGTTARNLTSRRRRCSLLKLLQKQLVPEPLPFGRLGERFDPIAHDLFLLVDHPLLPSARRHSAQVAEELLPLGREYEVGEEQRRIRMRRVRRQRDPLRAPDQPLRPPPNHPARRGFDPVC